MKPRIAITRATFPEVVEHLAQHFEVDASPTDEVLTPLRLVEKLAGKDGAIVTGLDRFDASVIAKMPKVRALSTWAAGYNNFDLAAMTAAGVVVTYSPKVQDEAVADFAWALMLAAARRVTESEHWLRTGVWKGWAYDQFLGPDLYRSTLGIIGMGGIGRAVARRATGFDMRVIYHNRNRLAPDVERASGNAHFVDKDTLLREADHVILLLPYSPAAHHMIGARELGLMKPTATLVNIARGGIVDEAALIDALKSARIAAAGLDVFEGEPKINPGLLALSNVVLTPHIGSASAPARRVAAMLAADNLIAAMGLGPNAGRPPDALNADAMTRRR